MNRYPISLFKFKDDIYELKDWAFQRKLNIETGSPEEYFGEKKQCEEIYNIFSEIITEIENSDDDKVVWVMGKQYGVFKRYILEA